jgi:hypothetical protein
MWWWWCGRPLLVLQALKRGVAVDASHPDLHVAVCSFFRRWDVSAAQADPIVAQVVASERKETAQLSGTPRHRHVLCCCVGSE